MKKFPSNEERGFQIVKKEKGVVPPLKKLSISSH